MAVSPVDVDPVALRVAQVYADAEIELVKRLTKRLEAGASDVDWERQQLAALQQLRREALSVLGGAARVVDLQQEVANAYLSGTASALADMSGYIDVDDAILSETNQATIGQLARDAEGLSAQLNTQILRSMDDAYKSTVADVASRTLTGTTTRKDAVQAAASRFYNEGIFTFQSESGRNWHMADYMRMAVRSATARASIEGHVETASKAGLDLVMINPGPRHCSKCDEWAGKVLWAKSGPVGVVERTSAVDGKPVKIRVQGSLAAARAAGFGHPNCRCNIRVYIPGVTRVEARPKWDQEGYEAQQRQRVIERNIREAKADAAVARTPEAEARAQARVQVGQATMREHIQQYSFLKRQSANESVNARGLLKRPKSGPVDITSAESLAQMKYLKAWDSEPGISSSMRDLSAAHDVKLQGYAFRLKEASSISRKIAKNAEDRGVPVEAAAADLSDTVRYTMVTSEREYTRKATAILSDLERSGYRVVEAKNYWAKADNPYQGVNVHLQSPDGTHIELQFHTPMSLRVKEGALHEIYEETRKLPMGDPRIAANDARSFEISKSIPEPAGVRAWSYGQDSSVGVFNEHAPGTRVSGSQYENTRLSDLGWDPNEQVTVYRGVPAGAADDIQVGDWVTTLEQLAKDYAGGGGKVISKRVFARDLRADPDDGAFEELVYAP